MKRNKILFGIIITIIMTTINTISFCVLDTQIITGNKVVKVFERTHLKIVRYIGQDMGAEAGTSETRDIPYDSKWKWSSSDNSIAWVNNRGVVTGIRPGTVTITAKYSDNTSGLSYTITVEKNDIAFIVLPAILIVLLIIGIFYKHKKK